MRSGSLPGFVIENFSQSKAKWIRETDSWCINSLQITAVDFIEIQFYKMFSVDSKVQVWVLDIDITCSYGKLFQIVGYASAEKGWVIARESQGKEENTPLHHHYPPPPPCPKKIKIDLLSWYFTDNKRQYQISVSSPEISWIVEKICNKVRNYFVNLGEKKKIL